MRITKTLSLLFVLAASACTNPEVPAGHEGYVFHVPLIFGQMEYRESLTGPASTSVSWRLYVENIDMRTKSFTEDFELLTRDNLSVAFEVNTRVRLRKGSVQEIVESWGGQKWYEWNVREPLRTIVREQVAAFGATDIQLKTPLVRTQIEAKLQEKYADQPIIIESVVIGEIQFPKAVAEAIQKKIATKQELERQRFLLSKTEKEAAIKVLEAVNVAKQQLIISSTLDPLYVQQRAVQVYRKLGQSSNKAMIVLPNSTKGTGLPKILQPTKVRTLTEADKSRLLRRLNALQKSYTRLAGEKGAKAPRDEDQLKGVMPIGEPETTVSEPTKLAPAKSGSKPAPAKSGSKPAQTGKASKAEKASVPAAPQP